MSSPLLSIHCLTYNHAKFIRQALDGFVMQKTNFPFEVIIHDDASTDGTADIIREYEAKYPDIIKPIYQTENQWSKGVSITKTFQFPRIKGKYVAFCEGDDYWTDPQKLQKQVDFLENNPDFSICFCPVKVVWEDKRAKDKIWPSAKLLSKKRFFTLDDLLKQNFIPNNSIVYRWAFSNGNYDDIPEGIQPGDWFLHLLHAKSGKIGFLPETMSVYRRHAGGIWTGCGETEEWFLHCGVPHLRFYREVEKKFNIGRRNEIINMGQNVVKVLLKHKYFNSLQKLSEEFADLWADFFPVVSDNNANKKLHRLKKRYCLLKAISLTLLIIIICLLAFYNGMI